MFSAGLGSGMQASVDPFQLQGIVLNRSRCIQDSGFKHLGLVIVNWVGGRLQQVSACYG